MNASVPSVRRPRSGAPRSVSLSPLAQRLRPSRHACLRYLERDERMRFRSPEQAYAQTELMDRARRKIRRLASKAVMGEVQARDGYPLTVLATKTRALLCRGFDVLTVVVASQEGFSKPWCRQHGLSSQVFSGR